MDKKLKTDYNSPSVKIVETGIRTIICTSGNTEGYGMSGYSYDEDDWN